MSGEETQTMTEEMQRGYVYICTPDDPQSCGVGYHGNDIPPAAADYLCDYEDHGYLVLSRAASAADIAVVDGWCLTPAALEEGDCFDDGTYRLCICRRHGRHEYTAVGSL
jgi:hypothetical protein